MVADDSNDDHHRSRARRTVMALSTIGVTGSVAAIPVYPTIAAVVGAAFGGALVLLEIFQMTRK